MEYLFFNYLEVSNGTLHDFTGNHCECQEISKKGLSPIFAKTSKSITLEICNCREENWNPKIDFTSKNRSEIIRFIQQRHPRRYRLRSFRDERLGMCSEHAYSQSSQLRVSRDILEKVRSCPLY
ncbi:hypothetical protein T07_14943 [Trichinella nelsoni]|uniref:Uncharacterized protein n=1 Tax=Trichinella nelsoni TaxID=6336 RepID=A0A0V0SHP6_9BILA|nr:hypothetical protein T07_14943 [Trichinella nelsoni]